MSDERRSSDGFDGESTTRLLRLSSEGEEDALDALYRRYSPALHRWAQGRLPFWARDVMETADLVQETLMRTLKHVPNIEQDGTSGFHAYLRQALKNRIRDEMRRVARRPAPEELPSDLEDGDSDPLATAVGAEVVERYEQALARLKDADKEAVIGRVELGLSYEELALALGKNSPDAARMSVTRALAKLARKMASAA